VRPNPSKVDSRFLLYYFLSFGWRRVVESSVINGATVDRVPLEKFPDFPVRLPDVDRQRAIADVLSAYDDLIGNNTRRLALIEQAMKSLFDEWFVRFRYPHQTQQKVIKGIPEGWQSGKVQDFYDTASGGTPSRKVPSFFDGTIPWVKTQELNNGYIFKTQEYITEKALSESAAKLFPKGTVLVAMYGATIGETAILGVDAATNQACCALLPRDERASSAHAFIFFLTNQRGLVSLSQGAAQNNVSQAVIRQYPMLMPPIALMRSFTEFVTPLLDQFRVLQEQQARLTRARALLLPRLMDGRIEV
jgi:type I restriction enzyme S subunit